jgi:hypothetical protein
VPEDPLGRPVYQLHGHFGALLRVPGPNGQPPPLFTDSLAKLTSAAALIHATALVLVVSKTAVARRCKYLHSLLHKFLHLKRNCTSVIYIMRINNNADHNFQLKWFMCSR